MDGIVVEGVECGGWRLGGAEATPMKTGMRWAVEWECGSGMADQPTCDQSCRRPHWAFSNERFGLGDSQASASPLELSAVQVSGLDRSATRVVATTLCFAPVRTRAAARSSGPSVFQSLR